MGSDRRASGAYDPWSTDIPIWAADAVRHAVEDYPVEACGVLAADATGRMARSLRLTNAERSPDYFSIDPAEQLAVWQQIEDAGEHVAVLYHSHTASAADPSATDEAYAAAFGSDVLHLIVSAAPPPTGPRLRLWRLQGSRLEEVDPNEVSFT